MEFRDFINFSVDDQKTQVIKTSRASDMNDVTVKTNGVKNFSMTYTRTKQMNQMEFQEKFQKKENFKRNNESYDAIA